MYDPAKKVLFIHVAKTGGSSFAHTYAICANPEIENPRDEGLVHEGYVEPLYMIGQGGDPHRPLHWYESILNIDEYFKVSIIRRPCDYVRSNYRYFPDAYVSGDFDTFIRSGEFQTMITPQVSHYLNSKGEFGMDKLFAFERFDDIYNYLDMLFPNGNVDRIPRNQGAEYDGKVSMELESIINSYLTEDYILWKRCNESYL